MLDNTAFCFTNDNICLCLQKSEKIYLEVIKIQELNLGENHPVFARSISILAQLYMDHLHKIHDAELLLLRSIKICKLH